MRQLDPRTRRIAGQEEAGEEAVTSRRSFVLPSPAGERERKRARASERAIVQAKISSVIRRVRAVREAKTQGVEKGGGLNEGEEAGGAQEGEAKWG